MLASLAVPRALAAQQDVGAELIGIEKGLWEAWKNHDVAPFKKYLVKNALLINAMGVEADKEAVVEEIESGSCDVKSFSFSDWAVHLVSDDTAILTYRATQNAVCDGVKVPERVIASSVYVRANASWMNASYHETPAGT